MTPNYTAVNSNGETLSIPASMTKPDRVPFTNAEERIAAALLQIEQGLATHGRHAKQACLKSVRDILKGVK
jgi:hypothetical protein